MGRIELNMPIVNWSLYYANVITDFRELKEYYPFCSLIILPTASPKPARIRVVAANKGLIEMTRAVESDFLGAYSRELTIEVPINYRRLGCKVFGANWLDLSMFEIKDLHFHDGAKLWPDGYSLCVRLPESFPLMKNVILENVKTAENMLIAYERVMTGESSTLELIAYSHGEHGSKEFQHNKLRYTSRK